MPSYDGHSDFYAESERPKQQRVDQGRCVGCDAWCVDGYFCYDCAIVSHYNVRDEEVRASTATTIGRSMRRRQERNVEMADLRELMGSSTVSRVHAMRYTMTPSALTREEHEKIDRVIGTPMLIVHRGGFSSVTSPNPKKRRQEREARHWTKFCATWEKFAWAALDEATRPDVRGAA